MSDEVFYESFLQNFPNVLKNDISFVYSGIRPKLKCDGKIYSDFQFCSDFSGKLISAVGIDSPGLTASLAIAEHISKVI